jgi:hypothetical protein
MRRPVSYVDPENVVAYVVSNGPHECGHIVVLFAAKRFKSLDFLPHEPAHDGMPGVLESATVTAVDTRDCVALAAGMVGELIATGKAANHGDDERQILALTGRRLEDFAHSAYEVIQQNLMFFALLHIAVTTKLLPFLLRTYSLRPAEFAALDDRVPVFSLAEVEEVYQRAEAILRFEPE